MNTQDMLIAFNQAWVETDLDHVLNAVTDDFTFRMADGAHELQGKDEFRQWLEQMQCGDGKASTTTNPPIVDGDNAVLTGEITVRSTDGEKKFAFCDVYRLRDGKIQSLTAYCLTVNESGT